MPAEALAARLSRLLAELLLLFVVDAILIGVVTLLAPAGDGRFFAVIHFVPGALIVAYGFGRWRLLMRRPSANGSAALAPVPVATATPVPTPMPSPSPTPSPEPSPATAVAPERAHQQSGAVRQPDLTPAGDLRYLMDVFGELDDCARSSLIGEANRLLENDDPDAGC